MSGKKDKKTQLSPGASVASIAQHKDVTGHGIKNGLQRSTRIGAADDGRVGCLTLIHQLVPLDVLSLGTQGSSIHKSTIALLQQLKGILRCHWWVCRGANLSHLVIEGARGCCRGQGAGDLREEAHGGCEMQINATGVNWSWRGSVWTQMCWEALQLFDDCENISSQHSHGPSKPSERTYLQWVCSICELQVPSHYFSL